jgi:hypothetical protein
MSCRNDRAAATANHAVADTVTTHGNMQVKNNRLLVQAIINGDSVNLTFDAGCYFGCILSDSLIKTYDREMNPVNDPKKPLKECRNKNFFKSPDIQIDTSRITYPYVIGHRDDILRPFVARTGAFAPNYRDDERTWEINFEREFIKIHDSDTVPPNSYPVPFRYEKERRAIFVKMPMALIVGNDTLYTDYEYMLDIGGTAPAFVLFDRFQEMVDFSDKAMHYDLRDEVAIKREKQGLPHLQRCFFVDKLILPGFRTIEHTAYCRIIEEYRSTSIIQFMPPEIKATIGTEFFKYFNVFIDLKKQMLYLTNHDKIHPFRFAISNCGFNPAVNKKWEVFVSSIYEGSPVAKDGLQVGDILVSVNDIREFNQQAFDSLHELEPDVPLVLIVKRGNKTLTINSKTASLQTFN